MASGVFASIDDKHVPIYRIVWIADVPHFCGGEDCTVEGRYEVRLDADESLFATREERDSLMEDMERWHRGPADGEETWPSDDAI